MLLSLLYLNLVIFAISKSDQSKCVKGNDVQLCIDANTGIITEISTTMGLILETSGYSFLSDNSYFDSKNIISVDVSLNGDNDIRIIRNMLYDNEYTLTLNDTFFVSDDDK